MTALTPSEAAAQWQCPLARVFATPRAETGCKGPSCACWRWLPIPADHPAFVEAVAKIKGGNTLRHGEAVKTVMADREAYGIPTKPERGYCGLGSKPEA